MPRRERHLRYKLLALGVLAAMTMTSCAEPSGNPAAPSATATPQDESPAAPVSCPDLNGAPDCFSASAVAAGGLVTAAVGAPLNFKVSVSGSRLTLTWSPPTGPAPLSYIIQVGTSSGSSNLANFDTGNNGTSLVVNNVAPGTYFFRVRARDASGIGPASNEVKVTVGGGGACTSKPNAPSGLTASVNGSELDLRWTAPSSGCAATSYVIEVGASSGSSGLGSFDTGSTQTSLHATLPGGTFFMRVKAKNAAGVSGASNEVKVVIGSGGGSTLSKTSYEAFGDSLTEGFQALSAPDFVLLPAASGGYPGHLQELLSDRYPSQPIVVFNQGRGGERCFAASSRLVGTLGALRPQVLLLMHCANDLNRGDIDDEDKVPMALTGMRALVRIGRQAGLPVLVASLPPQKPGFRAGGIPFLPSFNSGVQQIAASEGATFVDVFSVLNSNKSRYIGSDGLHLTSAGYDKVAEVFFNAIRSKFEAQTSSLSLTSVGLAGWRFEQQAGQP